MSQTGENLSFAWSIKTHRAQIFRHLIREVCILIRVILPGWPPYTENAYHTIPYIKCVGKCLSYNFHTISKNGWNLVETHFCGCLILKKQSGDKKLRFSFFEKHAYHTIPIYGNCMTGIFLMATQKIFQVILKIWPKIFFVFFNGKSIFVRKQTFFEKKNCCMQNLIFCVHNVVLDTIKLAFIFFSLNFFFKNAENSSFFCMGC